MKSATPILRFWKPSLVLAAIVCCVGFTFPNHRLSTFAEPSTSVGEALASNSDDDEVIEPVGKAEDLVKEWSVDANGNPTKPEFVLFITGRQHGYIEPCGCITLERQKGGLMRRHRVMKILEDRGWDLVALDAGNQVRRFGQQPVIKLRKTYEALCRTMNYGLIGLGPDDLKLPAVDLAQTMDSAQRQGTKPYTCANAEPLFGEVSEKFQILQANGKKIGVTMIVGDEHVEKMDPARRQELQAVPAAQALSQVVPQLNAAQCDMKVLIAFSSPKRCVELAKQFPDFVVLVTAGGAGDPTLQPQQIKTARGQTAMVQVGVKGMYVGLIGLFNEGGRKTTKYKRVQLDHRYKDTEEVKAVFKEYQEELKGLWLGGDLKDISPRDHPFPAKSRFVGSESCAGCHDEEFDIWENGVDGGGGPHFEATADLEKNPNDNRVWVQRDYDPECISCHATGWNPQNFYPYKSGLLDAAKDAHLHGNGCENCHGPGSAHVEMQKKADKQKLNVQEETVRIQRALEMRVTIEESKRDRCKECHDLDNSPDFLKEGGFEKYWPKIKHGRSASLKIKELLEGIADGKRPMKDVLSIQTWMGDLQRQSPQNVELVQTAITQLRSNSADPMAIVKNVISRIDVVD